MPNHSIAWPARAVLVAAGLFAAASTQAAYFEKTSGGVDGGTAFEAAAGGQALNFAASAVTGSVDAHALSGGGLLATPTSSLAGGALSYTWERRLDLWADRDVEFSLAGVTGLALDSVAGLSKWTETSLVTLRSTLRIMGDGEADGTPVRVDLTTLSLFDGQADVPGASVGGRFVVQVLEGTRQLVHWTSEGVGPGSFDDALSGAFHASVGSDLILQISHVSSAAREGAPYDVASWAQGFSTYQVLVGNMQVAVVPEPASYALWLVGLLGVGMRLRRQR